VPKERNNLLLFRALGGGHIPGDIFCDILGLSWLANPAPKEKKIIVGGGKKKRDG